MPTQQLICLCPSYKNTSRKIFLQFDLLNCTDQLFLAAANNETETDLFLFGSFKQQALFIPYPLQRTARWRWKTLELAGALRIGCSASGYRTLSLNSE